MSSKSITAVGFHDSCDVLPGAAMLQMDLWGTMNELMGLAHATTPDESMMYSDSVFNRTDNIAHYELQLLLGNDNFSSVYLQSASEVRLRTQTVDSELGNGGGILVVVDFDVLCVCVDMRDRSPSSLTTHASFNSRHDSGLRRRHFK